MVPRKKRQRYLESAIQLAKEHGVVLDASDWQAIWDVLDKYEEPSFVYAIKDPSTGLIKFGKSVNPGQRMKALLTGNAANLQLCGYCRQATPLTEREIHRRLAMHRRRGEWFEATAETEAVIQEMHWASNAGRLPCQ